MVRLRSLPITYLEALHFELYKELNTLVFFTMAFYGAAQWAGNNVVDYV